ncbi:Rid family hydrolase [Patulibacter brassicae]|jgi:enamine deaminase RidA (YjgF/YER057c/UK114 family)|uniref:Rid family hydrolase n=1 Tax=Patulibacter brassicae TaxID=1705717 RepID=A0ABU4VKF4_9ACTN|nr:Rid family hydrolase [Patulibacter brassicae]MDX8151832.1 Rid family hydrolase [Patulibacter brassicae]
MSRDQDRVQRIHSGGPWETALGYSRAIRVGDRVLVSGTTAARDADEPVPSDPAEQARRVFETIRTALEHAGAQLEDTIRVRLFVVDLPTNGDAVLGVLNETLRSVRPVISTLGVSALVEPDLLVEVEVEAIVGAGDVFEG